jgi:hypothetical protein
VTGFVNGDTVSVVSGTATLTTAATGTSAPGTYPITFATEGLTATNYSFTYVPGTLTVGNLPLPPITWPVPAPITYGTALSAAQLNATSTVAGTFTYSPAEGTVPKAGIPTLTVTFTPANTAEYAIATATVPLRVNKAPSTITWAAPAPISYGTALSASQLNATTTVAGNFYYDPVAGTVLPLGPHVLSVKFIPTDTANNLASTATVTLTVNQGATPAITWAMPSPITYGTALSATQLNAVSSVPGTFTYSPAAGTVPHAGIQRITATFTPENTALYTTATANVLLIVRQAAPEITWAAPASIPYGTALGATQLNATSAVAGKFYYYPLAGTLLPLGSHTLSVQFVPTDTADYLGSTATVSLTVVQGATPEITWAVPTPIAYGTALSAAQLNAVSSVPGTFTYTPAAGTVPSLGIQRLSATFTPTNTALYTSATAQVLLVVGKAPTTITWPAPAAITAGTPLSGTQLNATSTVPGTFYYDPLPGTVLSLGTHTLSVTFFPTDTAAYLSSQASVSLTVVQGATPEITWARPASITYGTALSSAQLNAVSSVPGTFTYTPAAGTVPGLGIQRLSATFTPTNTALYTSATAEVLLVVTKAPTTITWPAPAAITAGTPLSGTQLNATTTVPGTFYYDPLPGTVLPSGTHTLSVTFIPTDTSTYLSSQASVTLTVN